MQVSSESVVSPYRALDVHVPENPQATPEVHFIGMAQKTMYVLRLEQKTALCKMERQAMKLGKLG